MSEIEYIENSDSSPITSIAIGSFDLLNGIRLCHGWVFSKKEDNFTEDLENTLKVTLSTVHRQEPEYFTNTQTSTINIQNFGWYITCAIFIYTSTPNPANPAQKRNVFYSIVFVFKSFLIRNDYHLKNSLILLTKKFSDNVKSCLTSNNSLLSLRDDIEVYRNRATRLIESGIPTSFSLLSDDFKLSCTDLFFYSTLLTSHVQTKMTTIIETSSLSEALKIVSFLINFMFPFQISQSSIQHTLNPIPGLFLQIVEMQKTNILEIVSDFNVPVTWIKLIDRKKIYLFNSSFKFKSSNSNSPSLDNFEIFNDKPGKDVKNNVSNWALVTCNLLLNSQSKTESKIICKEQFAELVRNSLFFLTLENRKNDKDMFKKMSDIGEQDEKAIIAVSQLLHIVA